MATGRGLGRPRREQGPPADLETLERDPWKGDFGIEVSKHQSIQPVFGGNGHNLRIALCSGLCGTEASEYSLGRGTPDLRMPLEHHSALW